MNIILFLKKNETLDTQKSLNYIFHIIKYLKVAYINNFQLLYIPLVLVKHTLIVR